MTLWLTFGVLASGMLAIDLGLHRRAPALGFRSATLWTAAWITLALSFGALVWTRRGAEAAATYFAAYLVEWSLSVDNLFVFLVIFTYFRVPKSHQHTVLFWGIMGAVVMRGAMITVGVVLIERFHWIVYVFGAFLIVTGIRLALERDRTVRPDRNPVVRLIGRIIPLTDEFEGDRFLIRRGGRWVATPLVIVLAVIETTDLVFAIDSVPAVLALSTDPLIVYTSNVFAIMGLRALYFTLAGLIELFRYLKFGLCAILVFIGVKMVLADVLHVPIWVALGVVAGVLFLSIAASVVVARATAHWTWPWRNRRANRKRREPAQG